MNRFYTQRFLAILIVNSVWVLLVTKVIGANILISFIGTVVIVGFVEFIWWYVHNE